MARFAEAVPLPRPVGRTLGEDGTLAGLAVRLRRSQACLDCVLQVVPAALAPALRAGPWDDKGWTLLTTQSAALVKLRHLLPLMEEALRQQGLAPPQIRLHVLPTSGRR